MTTDQIINAIPQHMRAELLDWIRNGKYPSSFLLAMLENRFTAAVCNADDANAKALPAWGLFLLNVAPADCFGSPQKCIAWSKQRRAHGAIQFDVPGWDVPAAAAVETTPGEEGQGETSQHHRLIVLARSHFTTGRQPMIVKLRECFGHVLYALEVSPIVFLLAAAARLGWEAIHLFF